MRVEPSRQCKFHKVKGNHTKACYRLKKEIERIIQEGHLKSMFEAAPASQRVAPNLKSEISLVAPNP